MYKIYRINGVGVKSDAVFGVLGNVAVYALRN